MERPDDDASNLQQFYYWLRTHTYTARYIAFIVTVNFLFNLWRWYT